MFRSSRTDARHWRAGAISHPVQDRAAERPVGAAGTAGCAVGAVGGGSSRHGRSVGAGPAIGVVGRAFDQGAVARRSGCG
jgi:hypothetical protein